MADAAKRLPLPRLTMDPIEVLCLNDFEEDARTLADSLSGDTRALPGLTWLSGYDDGFAPYGAAAYFDGEPGVLDHVARLGNSAALSPVRQRKKKGLATPRVPGLACRRGALTSPPPSRRPWP